MVSIINEYFGKVDNNDVFLHIDLIDMEKFANTKIVISACYPTMVYGKPLISKSIYLKSFNFFSIKSKSIILAQHIIDIWVALNVDLDQHSLIDYVNKTVNTVLIGIDTVINTSKKIPVITHVPFADGDRPETGIDDFDDSTTLCYYEIMVTKPYDGMFWIRLYTHIIEGSVGPIECKLITKDNELRVVDRFASGKSVLYYSELLSDKAEEKVQDAIISAFEMAGIPLIYIDERKMRRWRVTLTREFKKTISAKLKGEES